MGTIDREDDTIAPFSSRGPTAIDRAAKPDLVAPGVGIESLSAPNSTLYNTRSAYLLPGTVPTSYPPYLSLSGTSMSAPVVAGTVALMLQANPSLTPNAVKAVLQFTAQSNPSYGAFSQGAGFLNAQGAVDLARFLAAPATSAYPADTIWSRQLFWGNYRAAGGRLSPDANAWEPGTPWGGIMSASAEPIAWGVIEDGSGGWDSWGLTTCSGANCTPVDMALSGFEQLVWGLHCGGADCPSGSPWDRSDSVGGSTVVWGTADGDGDTVVWGTTDGDTVVWGTSYSDPSCEPVVWPSS